MSGRDDAKATRTCILVCGLSRSGTSAVTRLINLLGADISGDLAAPGSDNIRGYWESSAVLAIHNRLLRAMAAAPNPSFDPTPLPADWMATEPAREAKRRLTGMIQREFAATSIFVVKDPRIWRLLPMWLELLNDLGISPIVVIPFRNPLEVAASLAHRDRLARPEALLLYFCAHLEIERASRATPRVFVRYDRLLQDWYPFVQRLRQISKAQIASPATNVVAEIECFLTADLYHHRSSREQMTRQSETPMPVIETFDRMSEAAETGDEGRLRDAFEQLRAMADATTRLHHGYALSELDYVRRQLMLMRNSFEASTSWRVTAPLRWLKLRLLSKSNAW